MSASPISRRGFLSGALFASAVGFFLQGMPTSARAMTLPDEPIPTTLEGFEDFLSRAEAPMYIVETQVPSTFSSTLSTIEISDLHGKVGAHSLQWTYDAGATLQIDTPLHVDVSGFNLEQAYVSDAVPHFAFWVYNDVPQDDVLRVEFCTDDRVDCWFDYHLNFSGWRTCWVRYGFDTEGTATTTMNRIVMRAPSTAGTLWLDQIITNSEMRGDHATSDFQVPFVQRKVLQNQNYHWLGLMDYWSKMTDPGLDRSAPSAEELAGIDTIRTRLLEDNRANRKYSADALNALEQKLNDLSIPPLAPRANLSDPVKPAVSGPFTNGYQADIWPAEIKKELLKVIGANPVRKVMDLSLEAAQTWENAYRSGDSAAADRAGELYLRILAYTFDQGWVFGSVQGSIHHFGYQWRNWAISMYLAEELLRANGLWELATNTVTWFGGIGRLTLKFDSELAYSGLIDVMNTLLHGLLIACVMPDSNEERAGRLRAFGKWINNATEYSPGLAGGFKPDGTLYHHMGLYMAYGRDALAGGVPVITRVNGTPFALQGERADTLRNALIVQGRVANTYQYPIAFSGRHPHGEDGLRDPHVLLFGLLAQRPLDPTKAIDEELATIFRRLVPPNPPSKFKELDQYFADHGIEPEVPSGYWQYGYGSSAQARRGQWNVTVRGHNRYAWTAETYADKNLYGRYLTYGQIEVQALADGDGVVTHEANGWVHPGYDWRRIPGTTTIQIPMDQMKIDMTGLIEVMPMVRSAFGGGAAMANHAALFGMDLQEHPFFNPSHRARISAFLVGDRVIALGSQINNDDTTNPTYTTLYQVSPNVMSSPQEIVGENNWIVDPAGNGFVVLEGELQSAVGEQTMPAETGKEDGTQTYAHAWIDHGTAPVDSGYAYALLIQGGADSTREFANTMPLSIAQRDGVAHVVRDHDSGITAYTVFEADTELGNESLVRSASRPALILSRPVDETTVAWSVTDPDLHLFDGEDADQFDANGNYVGNLLPYSRPWRTNRSPMTSTSVTLAGEWELVPNEDGSMPEGVEVNATTESTVVTTSTAAAKSIEFSLKLLSAPPSSDPSVPSEPGGTATPPPSPSPSGSATPSPSAPGGSHRPGGALPTTGVAIGATAIGAGVAGAGAWAAFKMRQRLADTDDISEEIPEDEA